MSFKLSSIFRRPDYQSEATLFIDQLKAENPGLEARQRQGRELLWDQAVDRNAWNEYRAGAVPQQAYVYQSNPK